MKNTVLSIGVILVLRVLTACKDNPAGPENPADQLPSNSSNAYYVFNSNAASFNQDITRVILTYDFNGDGKKDLLVGSIQPSSKIAVRVMRNNGDGSFSDATSAHISTPVSMYNPVGLIADFNNDGAHDIVLVDQGNGSSSNGGFTGDYPYILLGPTSGQIWTVGTHLRDAVREAQTDLGITVSEKLYAHALAVEDIDGDGDQDLFIETSGGSPDDFIDPGFFINKIIEDGSLNFSVENHATPSLLPVRLEREVIWGTTVPDSAWRWGAHGLADMDGDGEIDLVSAYYRPDGTQQEEVQHRICLNNGSDQYLLSQMTLLPRPQWNSGFTFSRSMIIEDLNSDGRKDMLINMDRAPIANDYSDSTTGRTLQILINNSTVGNVSMTDETASRFGDQSLTQEALYEDGPNNNSGKMKYMDFDGDGDRDIIITSIQDTEISPVNPPVYLNNGSGIFTMINSSYFSFPSDPSLRMAYPVDINGDEVMDFVFLNNEFDGTHYIYSIVSR